MSEGSTKESGVRIYLRIEGEGEEAEIEITATDLRTGEPVPCKVNAVWGSGDEENPDS